MEIMNLINEIASLINFICGVVFYIFIFGREESRIYQANIYEQYLLRSALILISLGAFYNVLVVSYPPNVEIIINVGYAMLFSWAVYFHYNKFVKK